MQRCNWTRPHQYNDFVPPAIAKEKLNLASGNYRPLQPKIGRQCSHLRNELCQQVGSLLFDGIRPSRAIVYTVLAHRKSQLRAAFRKTLVPSDLSNPNRAAGTAEVISAPISSVFPANLSV